MEEKAPEEHTVVREMLSSDSAARLSNEAKASLQKEQRGLTMNRLTLNFQSRGTIWCCGISLKSNKLKRAA